MRSNADAVHLLTSQLLLVMRLYQNKGWCWALLSDSCNGRFAAVWPTLPLVCKCVVDQPAFLRRYMGAGGW